MFLVLTYTQANCDTIITKMQRVVVSMFLSPKLITLSNKHASLRGALFLRSGHQQARCGTLETESEVGWAYVVRRHPLPLGPSH